LTRKKASVQRRKLAAFYAAGTCSSCKKPIVANDEGLCRICKPLFLAEREKAKADELEAIEATMHFRYYLVVRKKEDSEVGRLARKILGDRSLKDARGLRAFVEGTDPEAVDEKVLERAWIDSQSASPSGC
jgi:hypothetical protein